MSGSNRRRTILLAALLAGALVLALIAIVVLRRGEQSGPPLHADAAPPDATGLPDAGRDAAREAAPPDATRRPRPSHRISSRELRAMTRRYRGMIQLCYRRAARGGGVSRKAAVTIELAAGGRVRNVTVKANDRPLAACLRRSVRAWRFPRSSAAQRLSFPIVYAR